MLANEKDYIATRVAHRLNLTGPALSIHTGCSTSLVSIIEAVKGLRNGDCDMALAGGISISARPYTGYLFQEGGILSKDGTCRPFDSNATGTVFNDGAGVVLLKRLEDAEQENDTVLAVIKGVALNNDGADKMSFTAHLVFRGKQRLLPKAQADANIDPATIGYVEAHGTATPVGDPIEVEGLTTAFQLQTNENEYCYLGSLKSNIGHLTSAAGVAGLIKAVMAVKEGIIPGTKHFDQANSAINFAKTPFKVSASATPFPERNELRRAGVSSFGVGGTNAHVVIEQYNNEEKLAPTKDHYLFKLSAKTKEQLETVQANLIEVLKELPESKWGQAAYTMDKGRGEYAFRKTLVLNPKTISEFKPTLISKGKFSGKKEVFFMFPGQGSQYLEMGKNLLKYDDNFKQSFNRCCDILNQYLDRDLRGILFVQNMSEEEAYNALKNTYYTQPAIFVIEYSMAIMLINLGIEPKGFIGHSVESSLPLL
jgi:acyl transferase domain-containing protein